MIAAAAAVAILGQVSPAFGSTSSQWSQSTTIEGVFRNWLDDDATENKQEDFLDGMSRIYTVATRPGIEVGVQVDAAAAWPNDRAGLTSEITPGPGWTTGMLFTTDESVRAVLEKKFFRWRSDSAGIAIEAGDAYRALGRGLALSLVKNTELDIDTSIEGVSAEVGWGEFEAAGWAGWSNPQTISTTFVNRLRPDVRDSLGGGRLKISGGPAEVFAHANVIGYDERAPGRVTFGPKLVGVRQTTAAGGGFSFPDLAGGDLYVEGTWVQYRIDDSGILRDVGGRGFYGAASAYVGRFAFLAEGKHYQNLELVNVRQSEGSGVPYDYSTPPTLEKENIVNTNLSEALNSNNISGGRLSASTALGSGLVRATFAAFRDLGQDRALYNANEDILHGFAAYERRSPGSFWQLTAGYRYETRLETEDTHDRQAHADLDLLFPVGGVQFEAKALAYRQWETEPIAGESIEYDTAELVASVRPRRWIAVAGIVDYTTNEAMLSGLLRREGNVDHNTFAAIEVSVEPTDNTVGRVFAGATQGGLKCSGGTCRVVPAFEGVRVEWLARF